MASLTIRNLEDNLKGRLRVRAASRGHSMEEEARQILRAALAESVPPDRGLGERIRRRFAALGDVQLPIAAREPVRDPALVASEPTPAKLQSAVKAKRSPKARRTP